MKLARVGKDPTKIEFVRFLRNHPKLKAGFVNQKEITKEEQSKYMEEYGDDYYVCINDMGVPVGFIGVVDKDLRLAVTPEEQNKGIAEFMIKNIKLLYTFKVKVKKNNEASKSLFTKLKIPYKLI